MEQAEETPEVKEIRNAAFNRGRRMERHRRERMADERFDELVDRIRVWRDRARAAEGQLRMVRRAAAKAGFADDPALWAEIAKVLEPTTRVVFGADNALPERLAKWADVREDEMEVMLRNRGIGPTADEREKMERTQDLRRAVTECCAAAALRRRRPTHHRHGTGSIALVDGECPICTLKPLRDVPRIGNALLRATLAAGHGLTRDQIADAFEPHLTRRMANHREVALMLADVVLAL
jgi:hypothetical protein